jgi:hypothetical protein
LSKTKVAGNKILSNFRIQSFLCIVQIFEENSKSNPAFPLSFFLFSLHPFFPCFCRRQMMAATRQRAFAVEEPRQGQGPD